jgi:hypothetical protein
MLTYSVVLLQDFVCPCSAARTWALLEHFIWELLYHPSYSPDLALSDYKLLAYLKNWLGSAIMRSCWKVSKCGWADRWQTSLTQAHQKLIPQYDKCLNSGSDYTEK